MASVRSRAISFTVRGPIEPADLPGLSERVCQLLAANAGVTVYCDVRTVEPDAVAIDALARLQLVAHRNGCQVKLRNASDPLIEVIALMGLSEVLPE